ncbi:MAG: phosphoribosyltransferase family protein [Thermodesulfobacteriota bacterium]
MMTYHEPPFRNRVDAGRILADGLKQYRGSDSLVFAIPRGGIPVAVEVAKKLGSNLDIIVPRKIPIPDNPEAGYGAVTEDGVIVLNEPLVRQLGFTRQQIERHAEEVRAEIRRRQAVYRTILMASSVGGKTAIIVDDGLASGYTMMAAIRSIRQQGAAKVVAAAPVASSRAWELIKSSADDVVSAVISHYYPFAVASFYRHWHDLTDEEVIRDLEGFMKDYRGHAND